MIRRQRRRDRLRTHGDEGFTVIELVVVLIVIPLLIGGVAEALIVSYNTESTNSNRLSDTLSAQVSQEYFVRDVQGASYITTADNSTAGTFYSKTSPEVCSPGTQTVTAMAAIGKTVTSTVASTSQLTVGQGIVISGAAGLSNVNGTWAISSIPSSTTFKFIVSSTPAGAYTASSATASLGTLRVALFHPAEASGTALDVAYWQEGTGTSTEIDRLSCALNSASSYTTSPTKIVMASGLEGNSLIHTLQTMSSITHIDPAQFANAAGLGWTPVAAFTGATSYSGGTLTVGSTSGFTLGTTQAGGTCTLSPGVTSYTWCSGGTTSAGGPCIVSANGLSSATNCTGGVVTVTTTEGAVQLTCKAFTEGDLQTPATANTFSSCTGVVVSGSVDNTSVVTQSNVSAIQIGVTEPASSYHFSLNGAPRPATPQLASGSNPPTLLTLGISGIQPVNGGGGVACPDGFTSNICIGSSGTFNGVVVDSNGAVVCSGGGVHNYVHFQSGSGTINTVSPSSSSSCNTTSNGNNVQVVGSSAGVPDPFAKILPNNGCMPSTTVTTLPTDPLQVGGVNIPGIYNTTLTGALEPGLYIVENGIGSITQAPDSGLNTVYYNGDPNAGVLLFVPGPGPYLTGQGCFVYSGAAALGGTVTGVAPMDTTQSSTYFGGNTSLGSGGGVWVWQDRTNTTSVSVLGYSLGGVFYSPNAGYLPPSPPGTLATGSMVIAGISGNGGHLGLCLNWAPYTTC